MDTPDELRLVSTLLALPGIAHGFSTRLDVHGHRHAFLEAVGVAGFDLALPRQVHGAAVVTVHGPREADCPADAVATTERLLSLGVVTADCVPILLADAEAPAIAAVHAGWRGTVARVVLRAVEALVALGARPERLRAAIGPHIGPECYEVGGEVLAAFRAVWPEAGLWFGADGRHLDLAAVNRDELLAAGLAPAHIELVGPCSRCDARMASYRREGTSRARNLAVIALTP